MKVVVQRCMKASVIVDDNTVGAISQGLMLLVGFTEKDGIKEINYMVDKIINLRIFDDEKGVMNKSLLDTKGSILSVSQFTLYADTQKGRRPSYIKALNGEEAKKLYQTFNQKLKETGLNVQTGIFGANMKVDFINDGPIKIILDKEGKNNGK